MNLMNALDDCATRNDSHKIAPVRVNGNAESHEKSNIDLDIAVS